MKYEGFSGSDLQFTSFIASRQAQRCGCSFQTSTISSFFVTAFIFILITCQDLYFPNWLVITTPSSANQPTRGYDLVQNRGLMTTAGLWV